MGNLPGKLTESEKNYSTTSVGSAGIKNCVNPDCLLTSFALMPKRISIII